LWEAARPAGQQLGNTSSLVSLIGIRYSEIRDEFAELRGTSPSPADLAEPLEDDPMPLSTPFGSMPELHPDASPASPTSPQSTVAERDSAPFRTPFGSMPQLHAGPLDEAPREGRVEVESNLGAPTDGGRTFATLAPEPWRCPRCHATRQDWGEAASTVSGAEDNDSVHYIAPPPPVAQVPPSAGQDVVDRQTINTLFASLYEWAPEVCREVLSETATTYGNVHRAATSLRAEEEAQNARDVQARVLEMLLAGSRLEPRWPGLSSVWCHVISFATGAQPVPLRGLMQAPARAPRTHDLVAWQLPRFPGSRVSPGWFELGPQGIYNRSRAAVVSRVAMSGRQAARRAGVIT
jgi:hypothetical protein